MSPDGALVGAVVGVHNYGAGDLIELRIHGAKDTELLPFADAFVPTVDIAARKVVVVCRPSPPTTTTRTGRADPAISWAAAPGAACRSSPETACAPRSIR